METRPVMRRLATALVLVSQLACGQQAKTLDEEVKTLYRNTVPLMQKDELEALKEKHSSVVLLDSRSEEEYKVSHISGATFVDYSSFKPKQLKQLNVNDTIVVYCSVGYRSERVGEQLQKAGFKHVYNLYGGIFNWKNKGGTVVNAQNQPTEQVHTYNFNWSKFLEKGEKVY